MRILRFLLVSLIVSLPFGVSAQSGLLDATATLSELQLLIAQYDARIKKLESENAVLRYQMAKAGIQIPLEEMTGAISVTIPTALTGTTQVQSGTSTTVSPPTSASLTEITAKYGKDVAGFISQINKDWTAIRTNYKFPANAKLAGYEFVQTGAMDYVFADIIVGTGTTGIYDIKILYQFEKTTYKRKLIGIFDYNSTTGRYITRTGTNPFGGVARTFVKDPYFTGTAETPATALSVSTSTGATQTSSGTTSTTTTATPSGSVSLADITKAYNEKRYLSTISLSTAYLASNPPTQEILNIRYRTYFIIGKYTESLAELAKMEQIASIDKQTACNAQVIATYSNNQTLVSKYAALCKK